MTHGPTKADLLLLARHAEVFEAPGFVPGTWTIKPGSVPVFRASKPVKKFADDVYARGFILPFDWPAWTDEAHRLMASPEAIAKADLETCRKLVTAIIRADRFAEGALASAITDGVLARILRRVGQLAVSPPRRKRP